MSKANVLYLSYDGLTDPLGQSQVLPYLCGLAADYAITVVTFDKPDQFEKKKKEIEAICREHNIRWIALRYRRQPPVLSTVWALMTLRRLAFRLYREEKFDIVHCRSYLTALVGLALKHAYGIKFIFDMRGFWADERVEGGLWKLGNPLFKSIYRFFKRKEKVFLTEADHTISLTDNARQEILSWNLHAAPITVIPTCVDMTLFDPAKLTETQKLEKRSALGIAPGDFVLLYLGSWGTWYMTNEMLNFFTGLKAQKSNAKFLIITQDKIDLHQYPHRDDVIIRPATRQEVPLYICLSDAAVFFILPSFSKKASSATKMGEIMAMNVPVITNRGWGDAETIVRQAGGYLVDGESFPFESLVPVQSRAYCEKHLSLKQGVLTYKSVYEKLL
jgi:glycosyltransferase involved in cell wall biosynthesis